MFGGGGGANVTVQGVYLTRSGSVGVANTTESCTESADDNTPSHASRFVRGIRNLGPL